MSMSARARVKLCSGLAKIGWLSKRKFQAIFPKIKRIEFNGELGEVAVYTSGVLQKSALSSGENCEIKAGESIEIRFRNQYVEEAKTWRLRLLFDGGRSVIVGGKVGGVGPKVPGSTFKEKVNFLNARFLTPLDGQEWYYTEELQQAFGLLRNNENVGTYPNCRRWSKD